MGKKSVRKNSFQGYKKEHINIGRKKADQDSQILLTISILVSGREETTEKCIASLDRLREKVACELILTDTGCSTEMHRRLEQKADKVLKFTWCNDFAAARNVGLRAAKGQWFMYMDDDEWFEDTAEIEDFFLSGEYRSSESASYIVRNYVNMEGTVWRDTPLARMTRNRPDSRFFYPIHESLWPLLEPRKSLGDYVHHYGYASSDPEVQMAKRKRNLDILIPAIEKDPHCMKHYLQGVTEYQAMDDYESACRMADQGIANCISGRPENALHIDGLYAAAVRMRVRGGRGQEALQLGQDYLENAPISDLARASICGDLAIAHAEADEHEPSVKYLQDYLKWKEYFEGHEKEWLEQTINILDSCFEDFQYKKVMGWGLAAVIQSERDDCLGILLEKEPLDWWRVAIGLLCRRMDYDRVEMVHQRLAAGMQERDIYKLLLLIEFSKGYMLKETDETVDFGNYNEMVGNFAEEVLLLYQNLYQPFILEQYSELVPGEYRTACRLRDAAALEREGRMVEALREAKSAVEFYEPAAPLVSAYMKVIQEEAEAREEEQRKNKAELERLGEQVKRKAEELLEQGQTEAAMSIVIQLRNLVPDDEEVEEIERRIQYRRIRDRFENLR